MRRATARAGLAASLALTLAAGLLACVPGATSGPAAPAGPAAGGRVVLRDFQFQPAFLEVRAGTTVTWANEDGVQHTVSAENGSFDGTLSPGRAFSHTFRQRGTYRYHCSIHRSMVGQVVVK